MKVILVIVLVLLAVNSMAADRDGVFIALGEEDCGEYVSDFDKDRQERTSSDRVTIHFAYRSGWIDGFITAYNWQAKNGIKNITAGQSRESIKLWIANFCRKNPLDGVTKALMELIPILESKQRNN